MRDRLEAPDFDADQYDRPNAAWVCGRACEGRTCPGGPSPEGDCRATGECRPALKKSKKTGSERWVCNRPARQGGHCEAGPSSEGVCGCPIPPCQPARSLRSKRGLWSFWVAVSSAIVLLAMFSDPFAWDFISPGEVSTYHNGPAFANMAGVNSEQEGCAACHVAADGGPATWLVAATVSDKRSRAGFGSAGPDHHRFTSIDSSCLRCHLGHDFHHPAAPARVSCSGCHKEHQGGGRMPSPTDSQCAECHNNPAAMLAAAANAKAIDSEQFAYRHFKGATPFKAPRTAVGNTNVFASFSVGHPEFQIHRESLKELNTLRFNHQAHRTGLRCDDCHSPDPSGVHHLPISFEQHCQKCHSLQFDQANPKLRLPHGNPEFLRAFLNSLPKQYEDLAKQSGLTAKREIDVFADRQLLRLWEEFVDVGQLEKAILLAQGKFDRAKDSSRHDYQGCAYCHSVTRGEDGIGRITPPQIPDRWLLKGRFNHARHLNIDCAQCHRVSASRDTSDINIPSKKSCATCHSPAGGVPETCATCHNFHTVSGRMIR
ncbi:MAG: hypothetical protein ACI8QF_002255 [Limisphaerales bacterium]|jgi:hypothetical protein